MSSGHGGMGDAAGLNPAAEQRAGSTPAARTNTSVADAELADLDSIIFYYVSAGWPRYTDDERRADVVWTAKLAEAQSRALTRHQIRTRGVVHGKP